MAGIITLLAWSLDPDTWVRICWPIQNTLQVAWRDFTCASLHQLKPSLFTRFQKRDPGNNIHDLIYIPPAHESVSWSKPTTRNQNIQRSKSGIWSHLVLFHLIAEGENVLKCMTFVKPGSSSHRSLTGAGLCKCLYLLALGLVLFQMTLHHLYSTQKSNDVYFNFKLELILCFAYIYSHLHFAEQDLLFLFYRC